MAILTISVPQLFFQYPEAEHQVWRDPEASIPLRDRYRKAVGLMTRTDVLETQRKSHPGHNYSEYKLARDHLIEELGFRPKDIVSENFRLSASAMAATGTRVAEGIKILRRGVRERFFEEFDRLYALNRERFGAALEPGNVALDLAAVNASAGLVGLWEAKTYPPRSTKHEGIKPHQELALAISCYLFTSADLDDILKPPYKRALCEVVVFYPASEPRPADEPDALRFELEV
jgi:hypothetical protein